MNPIDGTPWLPVVLGVATVLLSVGCALHALLNKRDSRAAVGWIAFCLAAPVAGPVAYLVLGINRARRQASECRSTADGTFSSRFQNIGDDIVRPQPPPSPGNRVAELADGPSAYAAMLGAIDAATTRVWLSQYIFESRGIGAEFTAALGRAARRGVEVRVLLDRVGALYSVGSTQRQLTRVGVRSATFLPVRWWPPAFRINLRNHRKILLIDDALAYVGGMNIRNGYLPADANTPASIRDAHFAIEGPLVTDIAAVFQEDWRITTGEVLALPPTVAPLDGGSRCRLTVDGPDNRTDLITVALLGAIAGAERKVRIMTPYFLPPGELVSALQAAAARGVDVRIVLPATNNLAFVHWAMQHGLPELLRYDIGIYFQQGSFDHAKLLTIDDHLSIIGSFNIDPRSLRLNYEIGVEVWDETLTRRLNAGIEARIAAAHRVSLESWRAEPIARKLRNALAWLATPYL